VKEHFIRRVQVLNYGPNSTAGVSLVSEQGAWVRQIIIEGVRPEDVEEVRLTMRNLPVVDVVAGRDHESGEWRTAGQKLRDLNGFVGMHLAGGAFSILFEDVTREDVQGIVFPYDWAAYLYLVMGRNAGAGPVRVFMVCSREVGEVLR